MFIELLKESNDLSQIEEFLELDEDNQIAIIAVGLNKDFDTSFDYADVDLDEKTFLNELKNLKDSYKDLKRMQKNTDKLMQEAEKIYDKIEKLKNDEDNKYSDYLETIFDLPALGDNIESGFVDKNIKLLVDNIKDYDPKLAKEYEKLIKKYGVWPYEIEEWISDLEYEYEDYLE